MADGGRNKFTIALLCVAVVLGGWLLMRTVLSDPPRESVEYLSEEVVVVCEETGDEWTISRAKLERDLYMRQGMIDPSQGIANPNTGQPTGFPSNREKEWDRVIERINAQKKSIQERNDR
jgi:hypothetical protein